MEEKIDDAFKNQAYKDNPSRFNLIQFVRSFIISAACPFSIGENQHIRHCLSLIRGEEKDRFQPERLNHKGVSLLMT